MGIEPIAVVGLAVRVPDAGSAAEFWTNLLAGRNSIHRLTTEQLIAAGERPEVLAAPNYVAARPLLDDVWGFDNEYFGVSRRESELRNPQHRLFLELCDTALQSAATVPARFDGLVGVYGGCATDRFLEDHFRADPELMDQVGETVALVSNNVDFLPAYVSYQLGLRGPSIAVRTACSTSLVAVHLACQALRAGDCDLALAGGVEIETPYGRGYRHVEGGIDSKDGLCRPLDADASGTVFGSGGGVVALRRLEEALADGDDVLAVLLGSAVSNDGPERAGFTTPSSVGQSQAVAEAIAISAIDPADISYVELHGTGTKVGDPVEILGLHEGMSANAHVELPSGNCAIGSVKSNIGHLGPASGVVGLVKVVLALRNGVIPPTIGVRTVNPVLRLDGTPFVVADVARPWPRRPGAPRHAGVSSFGFGGTNVHIVVGEAPSPILSTEVGDDPQLLVWSGVDERARTEVGDALLPLATAAADDDLGAIAYTSQVGRRPLRYRAALRVDGAAGRSRLSDPRAIELGAGERRRPVFLFPGQGAQFPAMGREFAGWLPGFTARVREHLDAFDTYLGTDLTRIWADEEDPVVLAATRHAQPLLFAVELACVSALAELGVRPAAVLGHSVGELVAATVAGVFGTEDAVRVVAERARIMGDTPPGGMVALAAAALEVRASLTGDVWVSAVNGPAQTVVGGTEDAIAAYCRELDVRQVRYRRLPTAHAFHTPLMRDAANEFLTVLEKVSLAEPVVPMVSAASGDVLTPEDAVRPEFWADQVADPVLFGDALAALPVPDPVLVETGPGGSLTGLARQHPAVRAPIAELVPQRAGRHVLDALGTMWVNGVDVDFSALPRTRPHKYTLPTYPYRRHEFVLPDRTADRLNVPPAPAARPAREPVTVPGWRPAGVLRQGRTAEPRGRAVVVLPTDAATAAMARRVVQRAGYRVLPVTRAERLEMWDHGCTIRAGHHEDLDIALATLAEDDGVELLVDASSLSAPPDGNPDAPDLLERGVLSALSIQRCADRKREMTGRAVPVLFLTAAAVAVTTAEPLVPARAAATAVARAAVARHGTGAARLLDLSSIGEHALASEISTPAHPEPVLAVRGAQVWQPQSMPHTDSEYSVPLLRPDDRYLIVGDSDIGLGLARALADTGHQPDLLFLPAAEEPDRGELATLESAGARVSVVPGDITAASLARIAAAHPLHGMLYVAGQTPAEDLVAAMRSAAETAVALHDTAAATSSIRFLALLYDDRGPGTAFATALARREARDRRTTVLAVELPEQPDEHALATVVRRLRDDVDPHIVVAAPRNGHLPAQPAESPVVTRPDELTETIRTMWAETLGLPELAADMNVFAMGGDSLTAVQVVSRLQDRLGVDLAVADLYDAPTAHDLAAAISARR